MDVLVGNLAEAAVMPESSLEREFEQRLADSSTLAFRIALGVLRNRDDAEDVAQEAFLRAYRNFSGLRDRERFRAWIARITFRLALDRIRTARRREARETAAAVHQMNSPSEPSVEQVRASREFQQRVANAVDTLPDKLRAVLLLAAIEGYAMDEVGTLLGISSGTVKSRLFHARKKLAEMLR
jgi:RNA polymerase sigma-70 factor (ECF subfamily)